MELASSTNFEGNSILRELLDGVFRGSLIPRLHAMLLRTLLGSSWACVFEITHHPGTVTMPWHLGTTEVGHRTLSAPKLWQLPSEPDPPSDRPLRLTSQIDHPSALAKALFLHLAGPEATVTAYEYCGKSSTIIAGIQFTTELIPILELQRI